MEKHVLTILLVILLSGSLKAQIDTLPINDTIVLSVDTIRMFPGHIPVVAISHLWPQPVSFSLSIDKTTWNNYSFTGREKKLINIGNYDKCFFIIETNEQKKAKYIVYKGKSYNIIWNNEKEMWDLSVIK